MCGLKGSRSGLGSNGPSLKGRNECKMKSHEGKQFSFDRFTTLSLVLSLLPGL